MAYRNWTMEVHERFINATSRKFTNASSMKFMNKINMSCSADIRSKYHKAQLKSIGKTFSLSSGLGESCKFFYFKTAKKHQIINCKNIR